MDNKDIQNIYYNLSAIKAPTPIKEAIVRVITELWEITLLCNECPTEEFKEEDYPDEDSIDALHESVDDMIRQEQYDEMMAEWYLNREKDEGTEYYC